LFYIGCDRAQACLVDEIRQMGGEAIAVPADVTNFEQVKAIAGFDQVEGDFSKHSRANSYSTWLETHPPAKWGAIAVTVLGAAGLAILAA